MNRADDAPLSSLSSDAASPRPARILVVEDEPILALGLKRTLEELGYEVPAVAADGAQAGALVRELSPDLVLIDVELTGRRERPGGREVLDSTDVLGEFAKPVVYLAGRPNDGRAADGDLPCGVLTRPFRARELCAAVGAALSKHQLEERLRETERFFADALGCVTDGVVTAASDGAIRFLNPAAERLTGWSLEEARGRPLHEVLRLRDSRGPAFASEPVEGAIGSILESRDGREIPVADDAAPIRGDDGATAGAVVVLRDLGERRRMEAALRASEARFQQAFESAAIGMALLGLDGRVLRANRALAASTGYSTDELLGRDLLGLTAPEDRPATAGRLADLESRSVQTYALEKRYLRRAGGILWVQETVSAVLGAGGRPTHLVLQAQDVTDRRLAELELDRLSRHDALTGLLNRAGITALLDEAIASAAGCGRSAAVVLIDLDRFSGVNDDRGHEIGDEILRVVAGRLHSAIRQTDSAARFGGDEFAVVLPDVATELEAGRLVARIVDTLLRPIRIDGEAHAIGASVGVSLGPQDAVDARALIRNALAAMVHAKQQGQSGYAFYEPEMTERAQRRLEIESRVRAHVAARRFELHYQPRLSLAEGLFIGVEALLRWPADDVDHAISVPEFVLIAEDTGLIGPLGAWVIEEACRQLAEWDAQGLGPIAMSVNVSPRQFRDPGFADFVAATLARTGIAPHRLELEVTESQLVQESASVVEVLRALKAVGVRILIDDFGTGYASIGSLKRLAPNGLKIDRSFVETMVSDPRDATVVAAAIGMAHGLGLEVIAEGVETADQLDRLRELGCDEVQGFLCARPSGPAEIEQLLRVQELSEG